MLKLCTRKGLKKLKSYSIGHRGFTHLQRFKVINFTYGDISVQQFETGGIE